MWQATYDCGLEHPDKLDLTYAQLQERKEFEHTVWRRDDYYWSMLLSLVYNAVRGDSPAKSPEEFRYGYEAPDETEAIDNGDKLLRMLGV